jgi:EAL domain-containing protein (putative c-di-GMP-specific phosphodiesterase class I)
MTTTAEGVETEEQLQRLLAGACTEAQGFLFSKPRPASEVAALCISLGEAANRQPSPARAVVTAASGAA